ncbi:hypothetical protein PF438_09490 [Elizabethkingia meningoseptica]|uniref:hypothetical protein n=1 Tax=Elizabethkingia meningoseptica TaxID=238 RepID=UPI0022F1722F|nr:hypothetical protein [Elizabethkingia meningoseptica]EJK5330248.1 hypothetical protein [Elizabethkingia meningoseptica]WBS73139.1 hypothetical protein PF438_09490 [Elizabethkingia meningoseptica]
MVIISFKKTFEIDLKNFLVHTDSLIIQKNPEKKVKTQLAEDYMHILENDFNVISYCEQPFKLNYYFKNSIKEFIPDYYVKYKDREEIIILNTGGYNIDELSEIESLLEKNKIEFQNLRPEDLNSNELFNYSFLSNYHNKGGQINDLDIQLVFKVVDRFKRLTVRNLIDELGKTFERKAEILYVIWYLVSSKLLNFNREEKLSLNTIIWEGYE